MVSSFAFQLALRFIHTLMSAEADALCGAGYGERSETRINRRNGYREREFDPRVGTMPLAIPKLRAGSYFPEWLLKPRRRAERALVAVITECYVAGVSTRRVDSLVQTLGINGISKSQVSEMAKSLDEGVEAFRNRPLDGGPYRYLWLDAVAMRCRDSGRIVNVAVVVATAVNADGHREILGIDVVTTDDGAAWAAFLRGAGSPRALRGVAGDLRCPRRAESRRKRKTPAHVLLSASLATTTHQSAASLSFCRQGIRKSVGYS